MEKSNRIDVRFAQLCIRAIGCVLIGIVVTFAVAMGAAQAQTKIVDPSKVAPEHRAAAEKRAAEQKKVADCQKEADEQKVLPRDRLKVVIACVEK
jgi:hypothetical protein